MSTDAFQTLSARVMASKQRYDACVDSVSHTSAISGMDVNLRFHHLRLNGNGQPMLEELCSHLRDELIAYCFSLRSHPRTDSPQRAVQYTYEARSLFRTIAMRRGGTGGDKHRTGELGELLLFFLLETVLGAPQVVAKMQLKTNPSLEVNGSDGIHMAWNAALNLVDVFFGESKLYKDLDDALTDALTSIKNFHDSDMRRHELRLVTSEFKFVDPSIVAAVHDLIDGGVPGPRVRTNHACLVGYDWDAYATLSPGTWIARTEEFKKRYLAAVPSVCSKLQTRIDKFSHKHLRFEVFFLPVTSVDAFRAQFEAVLA